MQVILPFHSIFLPMYSVAYLSSVLNVVGFYYAFIIYSCATNVTLHPRYHCLYGCLSSLSLQVYLFVVLILILLIVTCSYCHLKHHPFSYMTIILMQ